ncbi:DUF4238 domain-containing protein [Staphylococcus aureus]|uniref:DUF4238 domain-containing protein n=1 Tax=Staphylococcus aureus TaxID=1280 RepID=UPI00215B889C|nr:DUF4238 domain-containing protein [Staphylococcus aureus]UVI86644.1 DUF4238 domain-containing protein [Staphylococcus aureus]UVJ27799.1 DUF4238 domain-containing protein [Staphylococcus aureus]
MTTKIQHYYPRGLLKHFANDNNDVYTYIIPANKIRKMNFKKVCAHKYTYESDDIVDNVLEGLLQEYESKACSIIDKILKSLYSRSSPIISSEDEELLYRYMYLQFLRTDAGRINFISLYENLFTYVPRDRPFELRDINSYESQRKIDKFNRIFKQDGVLKKYLNAQSPKNNFLNAQETMKYYLSGHKTKNMEFHIAISPINLITSDNPVIVTDNWMQIMMPINPHFCIEFQNPLLSSTENLFVKLSKEKARNLNEATINTANYYVISNELIDIKLNFYLYNRFINKDWYFKEPHCKTQ